ncbi:MAG TPA: FG-GAP repeat protein, partial [Woeseiaceae bacterium]
MKRLISTGLAAALLASAVPLAAQSMPGSTLASQAGFGRALALGGADLLVGEPFNETTPGMVHIYRKVAGKWAESGSLHATDANNSDGFGYALATSGNLLLVAANRADANKGAAYIFTRDTRGNWSQVARLSAADGAASENYGTFVALGD